MCGIAGTIYKKDFSNGIEITLDTIDHALDDLQDRKKIREFLDICWKYKSNVNFIRYCRNKDERKKLTTICARLEKIIISHFNNLKKISNKSMLNAYSDKYNDYEILKDCHWFLSNEIQNLYDCVNYYIDLDNQKILDSHIIFYKALSLVINSIDNRLEIRGRDSQGISIQLVVPKNTQLVDEDYPKNDSELFFLVDINSVRIATFIFKTANSIGALGENSKKIKKMIKECSQLKNIIDSNSADCGSIVIHTRWASVGEVSVNNCHPIANSIPNSKTDYPLILAALNGDIYNYQELLLNNDLKTDSNCTTDCLAIPVALSASVSSDLSSYMKIMKTFIGSYAMAIQSSSYRGEIILANKGSQGLYLGLSYDSVMFASDVYGLVESCRYFHPVKSGSLLQIDTDYPSYSKNFSAEIFLLDGDKYLIDKKDFRTTNITTRDIDKRQYNHFLEKEIRETKAISFRTLFNFLKTMDSQYEDLKNVLNISDEQVPAFILDKLKTGEINKIIITGMGTCYTAAAAIAIYMRHMLRDYYEQIEVEPHIASEGSAFYLSNRMDDTLVIVIAQSGTTIDTNVFVQMAKDRGACSLAIANKREGDVTFLVDGTLYIGNGRDIEISVPSTKTYTAQVIVGYLLVVYFCSKARNHDQHQRNKLYNNIQLIQNIPDLIEKTFSQINNQDLISIINNKIEHYNSWYVAHDDSPNSVCAMEIRIKFSEGCYHTHPFLHVNDILRKEVKNSLIIYVTTKDFVELDKSIMRLIDNQNYLIVINNNNNGLKELKNKLKDNLFANIVLPQTDNYFTFIPTIIAGQILSYYAAIILDDRKKYFKNLISSIEKNKNTLNIWNDLNKQIKNGIFNEGFTILQFVLLNKIMAKYLENLQSPSLLKNNKVISTLEELFQFTRRPIDTIKHQAKTITVGAVRIQNDNQDFKFINNDNLTIRNVNNDISALNNQINAIVNGNLNVDLKYLNHYSKFYVYLNGIDETVGNYFINYLNEISKKYNLVTNFKIARHYDLDIKESQLDCWIVLHFENEKELDTILNKSNVLLFNFSNKPINNLSIPVINLKKISDSKSLNQVLGSIMVSHIILDKYIADEIIKVQLHDYTKRKLDELRYAFDYISESSQIGKEIDNCAKILLTKKYWKCVGSGVNYNAAKFTAMKLISHFNHACAFDVLENHKHIDISAESAVITFIANIWRAGYQNDVVPEIQKLLSHNNIPIILTNIGDKRFDDLKMKVNYGAGLEKTIKPPIVYMPKVEEIYSFPISILLVKQLILAINAKMKMNDNEALYNISATDPSNYETVL